MRLRIVTVSLLMLLFVSGCQANTQTGNEQQFNGRHILFFTDVKTMSEEAVYYDALLQLKADYPDEIDNMVVIQASHNTEEPFNINTYPSLVIVEDNAIVVHIKGEIDSKETIITEVHNALNH
ncbi:hypothetical protein [Bacillus kexueae]|uniref:hypothetical protein n=1 Tax=Aeribacillus kexueae TaxID=2078952 RepID=UPI001FAF6A8A|nr:hypothetical protein [Bacillus kexueae]